MTAGGASHVRERPRVPFVSIVIPCRNEERYIAGCLDSIVGSRFPKDRLEVLVVDGMSDDGTREVLAVYVARHQWLRVVDNPRRITPVAFNLGVARARGDLIMIMSAHATYSPDAIATCVRFSEAYAADNVGGCLRVVPRGDSLVGRGVAAVLSHPFGVGNARYRTGISTEPRWVDTAAFGCYRREVFARVGGFNERLVRGQDMEFNLRLRCAGGRTLLVPGVVIDYYARSGFGAFCRHNFLNGLWAIVPFLHASVMPVSWRHLAPLAFVASLLAFSALAALTPLGTWLLAAAIGSYGVASVAAAATAAWRGRSPSLILTMPALFTSLHVAYGLGSLWGLVRVAWTLAGRLCAGGERATGS